jgi:hypothetical protein
MNGYWFDAASLLRGVFENAVHLCASAHGWFDLSSRFDAGDVNSTDSFLTLAKKRHKLRQPREADVVARIYGDKSGLTTEDQEALASFVKLMHAHVHETEVHLVYLVSGVYKSRKPASLLPSWDNEQASHYANISLILAWALARLLSYAIPEQQRTADWVERRDVLDNSLRRYFLGWKPFSTSVIRFIDAKFTFAGEWPAPPAAAL